MQQHSLIGNYLGNYAKQFQVKMVATKNNSNDLIPKPKSLRFSPKPTGTDKPPILGDAGPWKNFMDGGDRGPNKTTFGGQTDC